MHGLLRQGFFHTDHLGSTRVVTDGAGRVFERIDSSPFGEIFRDDLFFRPQGYTTDDYDRVREKFTGQHIRRQTDTLESEQGFQSSRVSADTLDGINRVREGQEDALVYHHLAIRLAWETILRQKTGSSATL